MPESYLDHAATTPMRPRAIEAMLPLLDRQFANPSGSHRFARQARQVVDEAREVIAAAIGVDPGEVVFTGCGTESDNTVIAGVDGMAVCPATEHHAVLHPVEARRGRVVGVDPTGSVDLDHLGETLGDDVGVVSVMAVNNEVGTITDLAAVAALVRQMAPRAVLHTDAAQAACWLDLREIAPLVDSMSLSAHKFGGPKGVGVLTIRRGVTVRPLLIGGGQERESRSGTHNVAGIAAMAAALEETDADRQRVTAEVGRLRDLLVDRLIAEVDDVTETVPRHRKVAGSAHLCIGGVENEALLFLLDQAGVCASAASACASGAMEPSHVLAAMGIPRSVATGALRLTLGATSTEAEIDHASEAVISAVDQLRRVRVRS